MLKAREVASEVVGVELEQRVQKYFSEVDLKVVRDVSELDSDKGKGFDLITMFHVLEHVENPITLLAQLKTLLSKKGEILVEVPNADDALLTLYSNKAFSEFTYWSCHLYLFNSQNLVQIGKSAKLQNNWIKQIQRYPLSNHLYWLSKGEPGGHSIWNCLDSEALHQSYEASLSSLGLCDTLIASYSLSH